MLPCCVTRSSSCGETVYKMKTVAICGSMRFEREMQQIAMDLEIHHSMNVLQCTYNPQGIILSKTEMEALVRAHYQKIALSDAVYVVDMDGYIGESVRREIAYAKENGKEVIFHTEFHAAG